MTVITLLTGRARPLAGSDAQSGIMKTPVERPLRLGPEGFESDEQADDIISLRSESESEDELATITIDSDDEDEEGDAT